MEIAQREDAKLFKISDNAISYKYPTNNKDINIAYVEINGRYPDTGYCLNKIWTETCYVIEGNGKFHINDMEYEISKGTFILINPGELYYYEGNLKLCVPCTPAWTKDQHEKVLVKK